MYYILDTETASLKGGVVELAWLKVGNDLAIYEEQCFRTNPERPIEPGAQAIHGIGDLDVIGCPTLSEVWTAVDPIDVIGHNVGFDVRMTQSVISYNRKLCTLDLARQYIKTTTNHKLPTLQKELRLPVRNSHSALDDVHTCRDFLLLLTEQYGFDVETLIERASRPKMIFRMPYGKHKGTPISQVPSGYRQWLLEQDIDKDLRYSLTTAENIK